MTSLQEALLLLQQKEQDLVLAAQIGQTLVEANEKLESQVNRLQKQLGSTSFDSDFIHQLEQTILELKQANAEQQTLISGQNEQLKALENTSSALLLELNQLRRTSSELSEKLDKATSEKCLFETERNNLLNLTRQQQQSLSDQTLLKQQLTETEYQLYQATVEIEELKSDLLQLNDQLAQIPILEQKIKEITQFSQECESLKALADALNHELLLKQDEISQLQEKLLVFEPELHKTNTETGSKSLLGEIEDKRILLEETHKSLQEQHSDLLTRHKQTVHHQQRMKSHINRLEHLSSSQFSQDQLQMLQEALLQSEAEKEQLLLEIQQLKSNQVETIQVPISATDSDFCSKEYADLLKGQIKQLKQQLEQLKNENNTVNLLRMNESAQIRSLEKQLFEKSRELSASQAKIAQILFKTEEEPVSPIKENTPPVQQIEQIPIQKRNINTSPKQIPRKPPVIYLEKSNSDCKQQ